jgi:hypothetical protein
MISVTFAPPLQLRFPLRSRQVLQARLRFGLRLHLVLHDLAEPDFLARRINKG